MLGPDDFVGFDSRDVAHCVAWPLQCSLVRRRPRRRSSPGTCRPSFWRACCTSAQHSPCSRLSPVTVRALPRCGRAEVRSWSPSCSAGAIGPALLVGGLERIPAATASLLLNFELVATLVLAALVFREHLGRRLIVAATMICVAGLLLVWEPGVAFDVGGWLVIGACVAWGIDNSVTARIDQLSPEQITFAKGAVAGTANVVLGLLVAAAWHVEVRQIIGALVIGALGYGASITLWVKGARDLGAARGQVIFATAPFVGAVVAWTFLGETVTLAQMIAVPIAAAGVVLSLRTGHEHAHRHEAVEHSHEHSHDDLHHDHSHPPGSSRLHTHPHRHEPVRHAHPHVPDLHHRHAH